MKYYIPTKRWNDLVDRFNFYYKSSSLEARSILIEKTALKARFFDYLNGTVDNTEKNKNVIMAMIEILNGLEVKEIRQKQIEIENRRKLFT